MTNELKPSPKESLIYLKIQQAKAKDVRFPSVSWMFHSASIDSSMSEYFVKPEEVDYLRYEANVKATDLGEAMLLMIPIRTGQLELEIMQVEDCFYSYTVTTSAGRQLPADRTYRHYRGVVKDDPNSLVAISFLGNEVKGIILTDAGNFNLSFDKQLGVHLLFNDKNLRQKLDFRCGIQEENRTQYDPQVLFHHSRSSAALVGGYVWMYLETEYDIYQAKGSVAAVESYISCLFNEVALLYENEAIGVLLSDIFVWNTHDASYPYAATTAEDLLKEFQDYRTSFTGNLGQLLTFRNLVGENGWAAKVGSLCSNSVAEKLAVSQIYESILFYDWTLYIVTHEFGHLLGSEHTQKCVWNGNNTAIDGCGPIEGTCPDPGYPIGKGTIMSYCIEVPSVGIDFNLGFGLQPGNVIRHKVATAPCVNPAITGPDLLCSADVYTIPILPFGATVTGWSVSNPINVSLSGSGNSRTLTRVGDFYGEVTITVTLSTDCGNIEVDRNIWVGAPLIYDVGYPSSSVAPNQPIPLSITPYPNSHPNGVFKAVITRIIGPGGPYNHTVQGNVIEISLPSPGLYNVYVYAQNACGYPDSFYPLVFTCVDDSYLLFSTSIDPSGAILNVSFADEANLDVAFNRSLLPAYRAVLYDSNGKQVGEAESRDGRIGLDTRQIPKGTYTLHIIYGDEIVEKQEVKIGR